MSAAHSMASTAQQPMNNQDQSNTETVLDDANHNATEHNPTSPEMIRTIQAIWKKVRDTNPLTHCITNTVVQFLSANVLLAAGASPAMVDIAGESGDFAAMASALLINLGTPNPEQRKAVPEAVASAREHGKPWVLDPVGVGALRIRTELAIRILDYKPTIIRGNASEIITLNNVSGGTPTASSGKGVDAGDSVDSAIPAAQELAKRTGAVVAVSGPLDLITDGTRILRCGNGDALLTLVTGGGCSLGAYLAAFASTGEDPLLCAAAAHACYGIAAQHAAAIAKGPGTFAAYFLDALASINEGDIAAEARIFPQDMASAGTSDSRVSSAGIQEA